MKFCIGTENGSGMEYQTKEEFLNELSMQIDDCIANGGTIYEVNVYADAPIFNEEEEDNE